MGQFYFLLWDAGGFWSLTTCGCGLHKKKPHRARVFVRKLPEKQINFICLALQKKRLESAEERAKARASSPCAQTLDYCV